MLSVLSVQMASKLLRASDWISIVWGEELVGRRKDKQVGKWSLLKLKCFITN